MKFLVLALAVACASAAVPSEEAAAQVVRSNFDSSPGGETFNYGFETENKIAAQAEGVVKNPNSDSPTLEVRGSFSFVAPDGTPVQTNYISNENGFQAEGSHIPVAPPVPELIARGLAYIASHPPAPETFRKV